MTLKNASEIAMEIGRKQLAQLARACGLPRAVKDSAQLHGIDMQIRVSIYEDKNGQYEPRNEIKRFEPLPSQVAPTAVPATPAAPPAAPAGRAMPWKRGSAEA